MVESKNHFIDLEQKDPTSWLSQDPDPSSSNSHPNNNNSNINNNNNNNEDGNFDRVLFKNLVEMVPLVESLMKDRRPNASYSRRASLAYTRTPSRDSMAKKVADPKGRRTAQTNPSKRHRDFGGNELSRNMSRDSEGSCADDFSIFSSRSLASEKDREELIKLQEQVEDLQKKLQEKDEVLKTADISLNQMSSVCVELDELKQQVAEKDSILKTTHLQLSNAKIKLADKQAALEKLEWEAMTSNRKVEKLQEDVRSMKDEIAAFIRLFEELTKSNSTTYAQEKSTYLFPLDQLPQIEPINELEMQKMEEARRAYVAAVAAAKENPSEESLAAASEARLKLQAFAFEPNNTNVGNENWSPILENAP